MPLENPQFEASYRRLFGDGISIGEEAQAFFREFYDRFLAYPDIPALFEDVDLDRQISMLRKSLYHLVACYLFDAPGTDLQRLAAVHRRVGVEAQMFNSWLEALLATVAANDPKYDEQVRLAWCWALSPGLTYLKLACQSERLL